MTADLDMYLELDDEVEPQTLPAGTIVAERYSIVDVIGRGGMGVVYKAEQIHMERLVAMKMMLEQTNIGSQDYRRFQREAKAASLLDHPNIVSIHDFGFADGQAYLCMDYLEGKSLDQILQKGPMSLDQFRHIFGQACDALQHAHDKGIVHRDLKPSNLMITERRDDKQFVVVLDFGLVKMVDGTGDHKLTATNMVLGSPLYMSPEQCRAVEMDHRTDIYSLGCVMYEALTGTPPLTADTVFDVMNKHISVCPISLRDAAPGVYVPPALEKIIFQALAKSPDDRPKSMADLARGIERSFSGAPDIVLPNTQKIKAAAPESKTQNSKGSRKSKRKVLVQGVMLALTAAVLVASGVMVDQMMHPSANDPGFRRPNLSVANSGSSNRSSDQLSPNILQAKKNTKNEGSATNSKPEIPVPTDLTSLPLLPASKYAKSSGSPMTLPTDAFKNAITNSSATSSNYSQNGQDPAAANSPQPPFRSGSNPPGLVPTAPPPQDTATIRSSGNGAGMSSLFNDTGSNRAPSAEQIRSEGNVYLNSGRFAEARRKFDEALSKTSDSDAQVQILARLVYCAFTQNDFQGASEYLNQFKDRFSFSNRAMDSDPNLLGVIFDISQRISATDYAFQERLAKATIEAFGSQNSQQPAPVAIQMMLKLNHILMDQGKRAESETILQDALQQAEQLGDQRLIGEINGLINRPPPGMGLGGGQGGGQPGVGPGGGSQGGPRAPRIQ